MSSSAYSKRSDLPWTPGEKQRLWKLKTTGETKDLSWTAFHELKHFPDRSNLAVQVQWSRLRAERGLPRQRRAYGNLDGAVPAKRSAAHLNAARGAARHHRVLENADDDERSSNGVDTPGDTETTENEGATADDSARNLNHDSQPPDELPISGSGSHQAGAVHPTQSSMSGPAATTSQQTPSIAFTRPNTSSTTHDTNIPNSLSTTLQAPPARPSQTADTDERDLLESFGISSDGSPHTERTGRPGISTHPNPPSLTSPTGAEREQLSHPLGFSQSEEHLPIPGKNLHSPSGPPSNSPRLEKSCEELARHVKTFSEDVERRINSLISGASLQQKELSLLRDSYKEILLERDELRQKLISKTREKEDYKKEIEGLKAELKQMKEEMRRVEEDKKKISGVCKTLEELVGLIKH
ncbi:hypothetical protein BDV10DRAFT_180040 [Aspergillus recurvatus]